MRAGTRVAIARGGAHRMSPARQRKPAATRDRAKAISGACNGAAPTPKAGVHNAEVANLLNRYGVLLEMEGDNPFRVRAYHNAARTIENLPRDLNQMLAEGADLSELPAIGKDLAHKIADIAATGRFDALEEIKKRLPAGVADLTEIPGLGPKRVKMIFKTLKVKSLKELAAAAKAGKLRKLPRFGPKLEQSILRAVERQATAEQRWRLPTAEQIVAPLLRFLEGIRGVTRVTVAGSYRRRKDTVGDIDILITADDGAEAIEKFCLYVEVAAVLAKGTTRATVRLKSGLQVDLRAVPKRSYGAALVYFTGSKSHNIALRGMGMKKGLKVNEYGVFKGSRWLAGESEADVYAKVGLAYIEPEIRENQGELEAARRRTLPTLITLKDIKGDLHAHTEASDGEATITAMAEAAAACGYEYIAISDHTKHVGIVHGLDARQLTRQMAAIDRLNARNAGIRVLKSAEVDILPDGSLGIETGVLGELDFVIAAIHTQFTLDAGAQTDRLIRAMDNRCVNIIAHPTGRLLGAREAIPLDMKRLMRAAVERGCYLEVNAQPTRLDLSDAHCRMAKDLGLKLAISTDAHTTETLGFMRFGVDQARRGWIEPHDIINTRRLDSLLKLFER